MHRYQYNIVRFEKWLVANGHPAIHASLERTILVAYRQYLEALPQRPSVRCQGGGSLRVLLESVESSPASAAAARCSPLAGPITSIGQSSGAVERLSTTSR